MYIIYLLIIILILHQSIKYNDKTNTKELFSNLNDNNIEKKNNLDHKFKLSNIHNNYNKYEKHQYYLKPDCIFDTSCILEPNNSSFQNYNNLLYDNNPFYSNSYNLINKPNQINKNITKLHRAYKLAFHKNKDKLSPKINVDDVVIQSCLA